MVNSDYAYNLSCPVLGQKALELKAKIADKYPDVSGADMAIEMVAMRCG